MFGHRYFGRRFYGPRYFGGGSSGGGGTLTGFDAPNGDGDFDVKAAAATTGFNTV